MGKTQGRLIGALVTARGMTEELGGPALGELLKERLLYATILGILRVGENDFIYETCRESREVSYS